MESASALLDHASLSPTAARALPTLLRKALRGALTNDDRSRSAETLHDAPARVAREQAVSFVRWLGLLPLPIATPATISSSCLEERSLLRNDCWRYVAKLTGAALSSDTFGPEVESSRCSWLGPKEPSRDRPREGNGLEMLRGALGCWYLARQCRAGTSDAWPTLPRFWRRQSGVCRPTQSASA